MGGWSWWGGGRTARALAAGQCLPVARRPRPFPPLPTPFPPPRYYIIPKAVSEGGGDAGWGAVGGAADADAAAGAGGWEFEAEGDEEGLDCEADDEDALNGGGEMVGGTAADDAGDDDLFLDAKALGFELAEPDDRGSDKRDRPDRGEDSLAALDEFLDGWDLDEAAGVKDEEAPLDLEPEGEADASAPPPVLCARCFSLRNYGRVKSAAAEASLPGFDLEQKVGRKLALARFRRQVVLVVVDVADFDGSLPRKALAGLLAAQAAAPVPERLPAPMPA